MGAWKKALHVTREDRCGRNLISVPNITGSTFSKVWTSTHLGTAYATTSIHCFILRHDCSTSRMTCRTIPRRKYSKTVARTVRHRRLSREKHSPRSKILLAARCFPAESIEATTTSTTFCGGSRCGEFEQEEATSIASFLRMYRMASKYKCRRARHDTQSLHRRWRRRQTNM